MKARQVVKKIAALTAGLTMVGATIVGASAAADLSQYPSPLFIQDGKFSGAIVVGESAASSDVVGSIEVATALQAAAVKKKTTTGGGMSYTVADGFRIQESGNPLTIGKFIQQVQDTNIDDTDMSTMLAEGTYDDNEGTNDNTVDFRQEINLGSARGKVVFDQDDSDAPLGQPYLFFQQGGTAFTYILDFNEEVDVDNSTAALAATDIEDTEISLLGQTFTITDATGGGTNNAIDKVTLLAGSTVIWLAKDEPITRVVNGVEHEVALNGVNNNEDRCSLAVDGSSVVIEIGQTKTVNGVEIGVSDAIHSDTGLDNCKVNVGATKIVIDDGQEVEINDKDIEDTTGNMRNTAADQWDGFNISVSFDDDVYLAPGEEVVDPVFGVFKFVFGGLEQKDVETFTFKASADDGTFTFPNLDGKEIKLDVTLDSDDDLVLGDGTDINQQIYLEGQACNFVTAATECEGAKFLAISSGGEAHLMEITNVDATDATIDIKDITYGTDNDDKTFDSDTVGAATSIALSAGVGTIQLQAANSTGGAGGTLDNLEFTDIDLSASGAQTDGQAFLVFQAISKTTTPPSADFVTFLEDNEDSQGGVLVNISLSVDSDGDLNINAPVVTTGSFAATSVDFSKDNDDDQWYVTNWSTTILHDGEDKQSLVITYPKEYREGIVYISEVGEAVSLGESVSVSELQPIQVGSAKLDSEISDVMAQNVLVVGGPCVNSVAAKLMGNPADCAEGFAQGEAMIKLWEHTNGKVALLVAGYSAMDTRRASRVLANYKDYADELKGTEVVVKGTTLSDVRIESATV